MKKATINTETLQENAYKLAGLKIHELAKKLNVLLPENIKHNKGAVGELLEIALGANNSSHAGPDFTELGIELKTIPVDVNGTPKESTFVCTVHLTAPKYLTWQSSLVKQKLAKVLWVPIVFVANKSYQNAQIGCPLLWQMPASIEAVLKSDYDELMHMLAIGKFSEITAKYGQCLQIRPKAQNYIANTVAYNEEGELEPTLRRAFYLRRSFTTSILKQNYV